MPSSAYIFLLIAMIAGVVLEEGDPMKKLRVLALVTMLAVSLLLILPYFVEGLHWTIIEMGAFYLFGMIALISLLFASPTPEKDRLRTKRAETGEVKTVTAIACYGCKHVEEREFRKGDFIGKALDRCPECRGQLHIRAIYALEDKGKRP